MARWTRSTCVAVLLVAVLSSPSAVTADLTVASNFVRTGQSEALVAPLAQFGGATTEQFWSGLVEVIVSGTGTNNVVTIDAFYFFNPAAPATHSPSTVGFRLSFTGCAAHDCGNPPWILSFLRFTDVVGPVAPPTNNDPTGVMPYAITHEYRFVMDVGATPQRLTMGDGDGGIFDNTGAYTIRLFAVVPRPPAQPPFSVAAVRCQREIGRTTAVLFLAVQTLHARCLNAEASGDSCNIQFRDSGIATALSLARTVLDSHCSDATLDELGFVGNVAMIKSVLLQTAIDRAEMLIRETYVADYESKP